ncbi:uncharacterized protein LOC128091161 isoform X2 [Tympanuchus pallidicinctus]|uniref:uncharacterized protein LOC128091161 isoform X2 n=1 Tax=Tympanuchus pallidicinctus TaxID=109042 RepID=UPI002286E975|nr:uncharacterized protein LOC128091161 isoform X2 [Tympanuchus pallidicinctus]
MDLEAEVKKQVNPFYCNICKIWCASALNLQTHFLGFKHKKVEEALKAHGIVKTASGTGDRVKAPLKLPGYVQAKPERYHGQTLEEQLNTCKDSEPALDPNADDSPSKAKVQHVDTSLSNEEGMDCKNKDGKLPDPIQEEKNAQEEQEHCQKEQAIPDEKAGTNTAVESTKGNLTEEGSSSEKCETNIQLQEENEEVEQASAAAAEEFTSQEELLSYLQSFEILNEDDAAFILKVTQTLTDALVEYRQQAASKKDLLDNECNGEEALERSTEQSELTSADISDSDTDNSSSRSAKKSLSINEEDELQNFSTGSLDTAYENNVTAEFLNSVRNMNVEEVTATLHKIAATNPAFRGMDIPNVVKILTESGTLRRPSNGSTH